MLSLSTIVAAMGGGARRRANRRVEPLRTGRRDVAHTDPTPPDDGPDAALARRFADGDPDALRALYDRYGRAVFTVAFATLRDRQLTAEAVQVTFLKAWRSADRYDPARPFAPWIYSIARRAAIDVARRERRHAGAELHEADAVTSVGMEHTWDAWQVRRAVDRLDDTERQVVRLQHFEQLTQREIAQRLNLPLGTVKSRVHRAHRRLASALAHLEEVDA